MQQDVYTLDNVVPFGATHTHEFETSSLVPVEPNLAKQTLSHFARLNLGSSLIVRTYL